MGVNVNDVDEIFKTFFGGGMPFGMRMGGMPGMGVDPDDIANMNGLVCWT